MDKLIIVAGPTASGKTAVAVALAKLIGGEVVSADSMQIYTGMDIGTAKPTMEEQDNIPHHMIDIIKPDEPYSAALYQQQARAVIKEIHARGRVPILCGGTGFYINAVQNDVRFADDTESNNPPDFAMREHFANIALEHGREQLHTMLHKADPMAAKTIHANNIKRVSRALSYIHTTGQLFSEYNAVQKVQPFVYDAIFCKLCVDRPILYKRINERTQAMFDAGLEHEVASLMAQGFQPRLPSMQGIGYKEVIQLITGQCSRTQAIEAVMQNTRRYAKRQETWFKNQNPRAHAISAQGRASDIAQHIIKKTWD